MNNRVLSFGPSLHTHIVLRCTSKYVLQSYAVRAMSTTATSTDTVKKLKKEKPTFSIQRKGPKEAGRPVLREAVRALAESDARAQAGTLTRATTQAEMRAEILADMQREAGGPTIDLTDEERESDVRELSFEQIYRRILRTFEEQKLISIAVLLELLRKVESKDEWDQFLIIARVVQSRLLMITAGQAEFLICSAINKGYKHDVLKLLEDNIIHLFPRLNTYTTIMEAFESDKDTQSIVRVMNLMTGRALKMTEIQYGIVVRALCREDRIIDALMVARAARAGGIPIQRPNYYGGLFLGLARRENWDDIKVFAENIPILPTTSVAVQMCIAQAYKMLGDDRALSKFYSQTDLQKLLSKAKEYKQKEGAFSWLDDFINHTEAHIAGGHQTQPAVE